MEPKIEQTNKAVETSMGLVSASVPRYLEDIKMIDLPFSSGVYD